MNPRLDLAELLTMSTRLKLYFAIWLALSFGGPVAANLPYPYNPLVCMACFAGSFLVMLPLICHRLLAEY